MMLTADEARDISNVDGEDYKVIKILSDKILTEALKGCYFIEVDYISWVGNNIVICAYFQSLGYAIEIEESKDNSGCFPLKRIRISWR